MTARGGIANRMNALQRKGLLQPPILPKKRQDEGTTNGNFRELDKDSGRHMAQLRRESPRFDLESSCQRDPLSWTLHCYRHFLRSTCIRRKCSKEENEQNYNIHVPSWTTDFVVSIQNRYSSQHIIFLLLRPCLFLQYLYGVV